jgi:hypothetical protein
MRYAGEWSKAGSGAIAKNLSDPLHGTDKFVAAGWENRH